VFQEPAPGHYDRHPPGDRLLHPHEHLLLHSPLQVRPAPVKRRCFREYALDDVYRLAQMLPDLVSFIDALTSDL